MVEIVRLNFGRGVNGCEDDWCVSDPGPGHGSAHVDATGYVYGRACISCGTDLTDIVGMYVFITHAGWAWCAPDDKLLCVKCGSNSGNTVTYERYRELVGPWPWLPEVPEIPATALRAA